MGTRALFFIGDPRKVDAGGFTKAEWVGYINWDGYPDGHPSRLVGALTDYQAKTAMLEVIKGGEGSLPQAGEFPYPWPDNIFLTDYSYYYADGAVRVVEHGGMTIDDVLSSEDLERTDYPSGVKIRGHEVWPGIMRDSSIIAVQG